MNVGNLPSLLHAREHPTPGVSLPFLYWGTWKSMFAWHKEVRSHTLTRPASVCCFASSPHFLSAPVSCAVRM